MAHSRADHRDAVRSGGSSGGSLVLGVLGGAVLGAMGLGWWLLSEADRRRRQRPYQAALSPDPRRPLIQDTLTPVAQRLRMPRTVLAEPALQERVQQLNQAIDEVRRQLEALQPQP